MIERETGSAASVIDSRTALSRVIEMGWANFVAAESASDQDARHAATSALAKLLATASHQSMAHAVDRARLIRLIAAMERAITDLRRDGDKHAEAEMRHELALLLREFATLLAGKPLRMPTSTAWT